MRKSGNSGGRLSGALPALPEASGKVLAAENGSMDVSDGEETLPASTAPTKTTARMLTLTKVVLNPNECLFVSIHKSKREKSVEGSSGWGKAAKRGAQCDFGMGPLLNYLLPASVRPPVPASFCVFRRLLQSSHKSN